MRTLPTLQHGPNHDSSAGMVQEYQSTSSTVLQALRRVLPKAENKQLAAENVSLKELMASKELSWEQKYQKLLTLGEKDSLAATLCLARKDMKGMVKATKDNEKQFEDQHRKMDLKNKEKEEKVHSLKKTVHLQKLEMEEVVTELRTLQENLERKVQQVTLEKNELIATVRDKKKALVENMMKLGQKELAIKQCETEWRTKYKALEDRLTTKVAEKEASLEKAQELQTKSQQMEDEWRHKESQMEEEIKLLTQQNAELHELAGKTDNEKA